MSHTILVVQEGRLIREVLEQEPTAPWVYGRIDGDTFEHACYVGPEDGRQLIAVVNENGIAEFERGKVSQAPNVYLLAEGYHRMRLFGPVVIVSTRHMADPEDGKTWTGLTAVEQQCVQLIEDPRVDLPILRIFYPPFEPMSPEEAIAELRRRRRPS